MLVVDGTLFTVILRILVPEEQRAVLLIYTDVTLILIGRAISLASFLNALPFSIILLLFKLAIFNRFVFSSGVFS